MLLAIPSLSLATDEVITTQGTVLTVTQTVQSSNAVATLPANVIVSTGRIASAVYITCEDANIRWTVGGVDPVIEALPTVGLGHILYSTYSIRIVNGHWIRTFRYLSETADSHARLQITAEFNN